MYIHCYLPKPTCFSHRALFHSTVQDDNRTLGYIFLTNEMNVEPSIVFFMEKCFFDLSLHIDIILKFHFELQYLVMW